MMVPQGRTFGIDLAGICTRCHSSRPSQCVSQHCKNTCHPVFCYWTHALMCLDVVSAGIQLLLECRMTEKFFYCIMLSADFSVHGGSRQWLSSVQMLTFQMRRNGSHSWLNWQNFQHLPGYSIPCCCIILVFSSFMLFFTFFRCSKMFLKPIPVGFGVFIMFIMGFLSDNC